MVKRLHIGVGLRRQRSTPLYPSEPGYVQEMRATSKMLVDELLSIVDQFEDVSTEVMMEALQPTFEKAKYYTPKDTMELVESAYLVSTTFRSKPRVEMGFARAGKPHYGIYVHEIVEYQHAEPTRAKFLEAAVFEDLDDLYQRLGAGYRTFMGGT